MADPAPYILTYSYSGYQASNPAKPLPAGSVDNDLALIAASTTQLVEAIKSVRRSDGALQNNIVTADALAPDLVLPLYTPDAKGLSAEKTAYDGSAKGFSFLDITLGKVYWKLSNTSGDWSTGRDFATGAAGAAGPQGPQGLQGPAGAPGEVTTADMTTAIATAVAPKADLASVTASLATKVDTSSMPTRLEGLQSITATVATNALTFTWTPSGAVTFRNTTSSNGAPASVTPSGALSLTVPSGATLGTANATQARLALLLLYNGGTPVLGVVNMDNGFNIDETSIVTSVTMTTASNSATTVYSTAGVSSTSFRVVGFITITEATAGTWATAPSLVQGAGGLSLAAAGALSTFGFGQTLQSVTRTSGTTYFNTTTKPIQLILQTAGGSTLTVSIGGVALPTTTQAAASNNLHSFVIPQGSSYSFVGTINAAYEIR